MKFLYSLVLICSPVILSAQMKQIAFAELSAGSGMFFGAQMTTTTITVTVQGPSDRYIAFGFGTGMSNGNDAIIWSALGSGVAPLQLRDHRMIGQGNEPTVDAQQDWTVISNDVSGGNRTIVASRALSTGDVNDATFSFAATTQNLFWSRSASASNQLVYHGVNRASGIVRNWVPVDVTAPTLVSTTPADNASGVSLSANLTLTFNEPCVMSTGFITLYDENDAVVQSVTTGSPNIIVSGNSIIFNPAANLILNTDYYVQVDATAITDAAGNAFAGFMNNTAWSFNTNDITAPSLAAGPFVPADNTVGLTNLTTNLTATFNENVQAGTGQLQLFSGAGTLVEAFDAASSPQVSISGAAVTINPTADLLMNTAYYVNIAPGAITDISGNSYAGISNNTAWNFNTNDLIAPALTTNLTPADGETGVSAGTLIEAQFSENIQLSGNGTFNIFRANGTIFATYTSADTELAVTGDQLTVTPSAPLENTTGYYIEISADLITDPAGNAYAGITGNTAWNFTTGDFESPAVTTLQPADNAVNIPVGSPFVITFDEAISVGTGQIRLVDDNTGEGNATYDVSTSPEITVSGNVLTITPSGDLLGNTSYHIEIDATAVTDVSDNAFAGYALSTDWNFTTEMGLGLNELQNSGIEWNGTVLKITDGMDAVIYDTTGKIVKSDLAEETDCSDLTSGVYFVHLVSVSGNQSFRIHVR